ncbi:MAG: 1-acyl-sn-glycerol-3-phosphate acyltransferase, partial [Polaromonas sp.]|nr:1-acyl-sn-glycerol-3-phosphate acyltransferase [Polaromonas sp.]
EGTTGNGIDLLPFHSNLLQAAVLAEAPVQPVAMKFVEAHSGEISHGPSFVGDETFLASLWRTLKSSGIVAVVNYGEIQSTSERDRRLITDVVRNDIERLRKLQHH